MVIKFPTRLKFSKENPVVDFYKKCMKQVNGSESVDNVQVTAFTVNPKDYKKYFNWGANLDRMIEKGIETKKTL